MRDRVVLVAAAVLAALLVSFGALYALRDYALPVFANGGTIARKADVDVGDLIAARFPQARVGAARCPRLLDLTGRRSARCAIPIDGDELAIRVAMRADRRAVAFSALDALFVTRDGERTIADELEHRYGERFTVRCPGPAVRVLRPAVSVSCEVEAPDVSRRAVTAEPYGYDGSVSARELAGVTARKARVLGAGVAAQREGSIVVAGPALERYLRGSAAFQARGEVGRRGLLGPAHCPRRVVLHEGTHVRCTVQVADVTLGYDVHFEKGLGLRTDADRSVAVIAALREIAARYYQRRIGAGTVNVRVDVNCGTVPVIAVEPGSTLRCIATTGGNSFDFALRFTDAEGGFTIDRSLAP